METTRREFHAAFPLCRAIKPESLMRKAKILKAVERAWLVLALIPFALSFPQYFSTLRETSPFSLDSIIFTVSYVFLFSPLFYAKIWREKIEKGRGETTRKTEIKRALCLGGLIFLVFAVTFFGVRASLKATTHSSTAVEQNEKFWID